MNGPSEILMKLQIVSMNVNSYAKDFGQIMDIPTQELQELVLDAKKT